MTIHTRLTGHDLLNDPRLNKGTAFTEDERDRFALHGLLPPHVGTLADQVARRQRALRDISTPFARYRFLRDLQDANETLFYALLQEDIEALLPTVYTPTVGEGCQRFSEIWHKPRGLFLSYPNRERIESILAHPRLDGIRCIVVSDGERILGLGDQGAGGMGIPIGKLSLYTALAGIRPEQCLPVLLDVGTDNEERLRDPLYIGWSHRRVRGADYDAFVERFVTAVDRRFPEVLLQWEDFAGDNAGRLLERYRDRLCTFNDDIQGTAAVATATVLAGLRAAGTALADQRIAVVGFGAAGQGIAAMLASALTGSGLPEREALRRIFAVDRGGLIVEGDANGNPAWERFARPRAGLAGPGDTGASLESVVRRVRPTILIGVTGQAGLFSEGVIRTMAAGTPHPIILPLSNPTARSEASPQDILDWTDGRALIATGSPFPPVVRNGRVVPVSQANNSYVFPGLALGILASRARRVTDAMMMAATKSLAELAPMPGDAGAAPLPSLGSMRAVSRAVGAAVAASAIREGTARTAPEDIADALRACVWEPVYEAYVADPPAKG